MFCSIKRLWPERAARAPALALATFFFACGTAEEAEETRRRHEATDQVQLQQKLEGQQGEHLSHKQMRANGFVRDGDSWRRAAKLTASPWAKPLDTQAWRNIGAVSVLSIDRRNDATPYLYATLCSLLTELPEQEPINVFVGNDDLDYVRPEKLDLELGSAFSRRVHVIGGDAQDVAYMRDAKFTVHERASWNYARMLRSYRGDGYHLTFEDDIVVSRASLGALDAMLNEASPPIVSLYNVKCGRTPGASRDIRDDEAAIFGKRHDRSKVGFWGTQAVAFRGAESRLVGQYLQAHLGERPFDKSLDRYMRQQKKVLGYALPSMVQHVGVLTTGLGFHHMSGCFADVYPSPAASLVDSWPPKPIEPPSTASCNICE